jgi:3-oxoacyl-[acyl-carrier protein] reductase
VTRPEDFQTVLDKCVEFYGSVEVLVNNAARTVVQGLMEIDPADFNAVMATNAGGSFAGCQIFGRHMKGRGYGRLINMASLAGQNGGTATGAHYAASKGAILTLTKIFARDLAHFGVTCNAIAPGPMDTPMVREVLRRIAPAARRPACCDGTLLFPPLARQWALGRGQSGTGRASAPCSGSVYAAHGDVDRLLIIALER